MKNKRGQIYIIAAVIIILVIIGLATITNRVSYKQEPKTFYELGSQFSQESFHLSEWGTYNDQNPQEAINNFTENVFSKKVKQAGAEFMIIYGNRENVTYTTCQRAGEVIFDQPAVQSRITLGDLECKETTTSSPSTSAEITFLNETHRINLGEEQGYYYIFVKKEGNDTYVDNSDTSQ